MSPFRVASGYSEMTEACPVTTCDHRLDRGDNEEVGEQRQQQPLRTNPPDSTNVLRYLSDIAAHAK